MIEIFHILPDDKFSKNTIDVFNKINCKNVYSYHKKISYKYVNPESNTLNLYSLKEIILLRSKKYDTILFHSLSIKNLLFLCIIKEYNNIIWKAYGNDIYELNRLKRDLFETKTKRVIKEIRPKKQFIKTFLNNQLYNLLFLLAKNKITHISPVIPIEFKLLTLTYKLKAKEISIPISIIEKFADRRTINLNSNNILIGNSANEWNNHLDIFSELKNYKDCFDKIILPISYPKEKKAYREILIHEGKKLFENKLIPLIEFIPLQEYEEYLYSCKCAVFNHHRQAAGGSVGFSIAIGMKVFINPKSELYNHFINYGLIVFKFPEEFTLQNISNPFSREEIIYNQEIIINKIYVNSSQKIENLNLFIKEII